MRKHALHALLSAAALIAATALLRVAGVQSHTTVALGYLLVVLFIAAAADLRLAAAASLAATLGFNYFFLPPVGTLRLADPDNWIVLAVFLVVAIVASQLSARARTQAREALERRREVSRLFDLTRDILLTTERDGALAAIARHVARRFSLETAAIALPLPGGSWQVHHGGEVAPRIADAVLTQAMADAAEHLEFDARTRSYGGHRRVDTDEHHSLALTPIRLGTRAIGLLVLGGTATEAGTRDALAGVVAIAVERSQFLEERHSAELASQRAELAAALLASLSHDLRTPLTAIRAAISNIATPGITDRERVSQAQVAQQQAERLTRLFDEILDMARLESGTVKAQRSWVSAGELVDAAISHAAAALSGRELRLDVADDLEVEIDPRLAASGLAHLLENAARYAPDGPIVVRAAVDGWELRLAVTDAGPGLQQAELDRLFEPFYRGESARRHVVGTGMGLAITRGLIAADGGHVWAENVEPHGSRFTIAVPVGVRRAVAAT